MRRVYFARGMASALPAALLSLTMVGHGPAAMVGHGPAAPYCVAVEMLALRNASLGPEHGMPTGRKAMWSAQQCGAGQQCGALSPRGAGATRALPADGSAGASTADGPSSKRSNLHHGQQCGAGQQPGASVQQCGAATAPLTTFSTSTGGLDSMMQGSDEHPFYTRDASSAARPTLGSP